MQPNTSTDAPILPAEGYVRIKTLIGVEPVSSDKAERNKAAGKNLPRRPREARPGILPFSRATLWRRVAAGTFPKPLKFGGISAWRVEDVRAWIEEQNKGAH